MSSATLFRYSGSKKKLVPLMEPPPFKPKRVVEPYLGGGGYILSSWKPALGIDVNEEVIQLWKWLRDEADLERLYEIREIVEAAKKQDPDGKPDVREMPLSEAEQTYVRVNVTGAYVGQLSSWKVYPQHSLPVNQTAKFLERIENVELTHGKAEEDYHEVDGDVVFLDPPYTGTTGNYKNRGVGGIEEGYDPKTTVRLIRRLSAPTILTYGSNAKEVFPDFDWRVLAKRKVPRLRGGGTIERIEHVCYFNWE